MYIRKNYNLHNLQNVLFIVFVNISSEMLSSDIIFMFKQQQLNLDQIY